MYTANRASVVLASSLLTSALMLFFGISAQAQPQTQTDDSAKPTAKQDLKRAGTDTKDATKSAGHGIAKGTKTGVRKTDNGAKTVGRDTKNGTKKAVHGTANATRKGADKVEDKSAPTPQ